VIVVASVSCIYGLGSPEVYERNMQLLRRGELIDRDALLRKLVSIQYNRNDQALGRGTFRVKGETLEVFPRTPRRPTARCCSATRSNSCPSSIRSPAS